MTDYKGQMEATAAMYGGREGAEMRREWRETRIYDGVCVKGHGAVYRPAVGRWCVVSDSPAAYCKGEQQR